jgi:hypothetical protein
LTLLRDSAWRLKYTPDDGDLVRLFYVPALRAAVRYDRLTGYFSARALALAARGVEGLIVNNGRMRLIVGCTLGEEEVAAIERGESLRDTVERSLIRMPMLSADPRTIDALELVAWMVANGFLDVKLAVRPSRWAVIASAKQLPPSSRGRTKFAPIIVSMTIGRRSS